MYNKHHFNKWLFYTITTKYSEKHYTNTQMYVNIIHCFNILGSDISLPLTKSPEFLTWTKLSKSLPHII